ncbi:MAG: TetR/AcrR family transcriptional regulator [Rhodobacterales bacterium]|nr:TetR/AcrR family transcriptional regulator [Rhodobacterales bacterium]MDX5501393.1 TetR/AcrR family transcriptional regulator [Rhodobacterales bacterium]
MSGAHHRRKQPELVRAAILAEAGALAARIGVQALTVQAVAEAAGVTKGGLLHHFPSKDLLVRALQAAAIEGFETAVETCMAADPIAHGRFTRAYVRTCLDGASDGPSPTLIAALWADPVLRRDWYDWMARQEARHAATDGGAALQQIRFAADGIWLALTNGLDTSGWVDRLIAGTGVGQSAT